VGWWVGLLKTREERGPHFILKNRALFCFFLYMGLQNFKMFSDIPSKDSRDNSESSIHIHENNHGNATVVDPRGSGLERLSLSSHQEQ
jgi:hypothetical protein